MPPMLPSGRKYSSLSKKDCQRIIRNFDAGLAILDTIRKRPTITELQARSLLAALRNEMAEAAKSAGET